MKRLLLLVSPWKIVGYLMVQRYVILAKFVEIP